MGSTWILPLKIYEYSNGNERYLWDQDWFLPNGDYEESVLGSTVDSASAARQSINLANVSMVKYFISSGFWTGFRTLSFDYYKNKIIRCHLKNTGQDDIFFELHPYSPQGDNTALKWNELKFYKNNVLIFTYDSNKFRSYYALGDLNDIMACSTPIPWINNDLDGLVMAEITCNYYPGDTREDDGRLYNYSLTVDKTSYYVNSFKQWISGYTPIQSDDDNPYWDGGTSEEGGGGGNFSDDSDSVNEDLLPDIDAIGTGFATLFTPSKVQLRALADIMWDSNIFAALQNLVENIQNMFTSLAIVPFVVDAGSTVEVTWLGLPITGIYLTLASKQYYEFDMGSIDLKTDSRIFTSGSALDYSPFSKLGIFLPFIGFQELDIDECRDGIIELKYRIDILSGTCVALISVNGNTIYQFSGNCLSQIPITNENMQSLVADAVQVAIAATATRSASGAASADMAAAEGTEIKSVNDLNKAEKAVAHAGEHLQTAKGHLASATANAAMGMKPTFGKAGAISACASLLAVKQPYLFLTTPRQSLPSHYQKYCGFPSNITGTLNSFSGFTVVESIRLNGLVATSPEVAEIYELLKRGVII